MHKKVLFIGLIWPEPDATAAGIRILQLIDLFKSYGCELIFCAAAKKTELSYNLALKAVQEQQIELNSGTFDTFLKHFDPDFVVFDRFLTEEQFGWRVEDICPNAIKILDTEDLHFLRKSRLSHADNDFSQHDIAKREIASIYRCDLSLIISEYELKLLKEQFQISSDLLFYLPFLENPIEKETLLNYGNFEERNHFISLGNFKHEPNWKAVLRLKKRIWPSIRKELPKAELHIYGAYPTQKVLELNNKKEGFIVKGWVKDISTIYTSSKVCLAPLEFGAGIKGKLLNSMKFGTPNITTSIGAEGMQLEGLWNGFIEDEDVDFSKKAVELYTNKALWESFQQLGIELFNKRFSKSNFYNDFWKCLTQVQKNRASHRSTNFIGAMLRHHHLRSTKFLSKYIELKNKP